MATKNNRRTLVTKRILKEAMLELLQEKALSKITIKEICERSEMSRSTFYLHYQDPFALFKEIELEELARTAQVLNDLKDPLGTAKSIQAFLEYVKSNRDSFGLLLCQTDNSEFQRMIMEGVEKLVKSKIPEMLEDNLADYRFAFIMHGSLQTIKRWMEQDFDVPIEEMAEMICEMCDYRRGNNDTEKPIPNTRI